MSRARPRVRKKQTHSARARDFFRDHIVIHTHIEKTAGSTLTRGFMDAFGQSRVWDIRGSKRENPEFLSAEERDLIFVLTGHFLYGTNAKFFNRVPVYVACVRPPLQRFRSAYDFVRTRPDHPSYSRYDGKTFSQALEGLLSSPKPRFNVMARFLTGETKPTAPHLFKNVEDDYLVVSPYNRVNDTLNALLPLFGGTVATDLHSNKSLDPSSEDVGGLRSVFDEANALDVHLVQFVEENYDRWIAELPARLSALKRSRTP